MSSANLLPSSAPPADPLYPVVAEPSQNFRLQKFNEISNTLAGEVHHYRLVAKKYKRARKFVNWDAAGSSVLSAAFSSASFGSALSVVGLPAAVPLGGAGGCFALVSSGLIIASKKTRFENKETSRDYHVRHCQAGYRQQTALKRFEQQRGVFPRVRHYPFRVSAVRLSERSGPSKDTSQTINEKAS